MSSVVDLRARVLAQPGSFADEAEQVHAEVIMTRDMAAPEDRYPVAHFPLGEGSTLVDLVRRAERLDTLVAEALARSCASAVRLERRVGADIEASYLQGFCHGLAEVQAMLRGLTGADVFELLRLELGDARAALPRDEPPPDELQACRRAGRDLITDTLGEPF